MQKSISFKKSKALFLASVFLLSGCSQIKTREESVSILHGESQTKASAAVEPEDHPSRRPQNVALILGPGGVRSFAHVGVLKEFAHAQIPIQNISGIEWGALIAALYASKGQVHDLEWKLYKMGNNNFPGTGLFSRRVSPEPASKINDFLKDSLGETTHSQLALNMNCPALALKAGAFSIQDKGSVRESVLRCLPVPPIYKSSNGWSGALFGTPDIIRYFKQKGIDLIILVNVTGAGELLGKDLDSDDQGTFMLWQELRRSLSRIDDSMVEVVNVDTGSIPLYEFSKRQDMMRAGEMAGQKAAKYLAEKYGF